MQKPGGTRIPPIRASSPRLAPLPPTSAASSRPISLKPTTASPMSAFRCPPPASCSVSTPPVLAASPPPSCTVVVAEGGSAEHGERRRGDSSELLSPPRRPARAHVAVRLLGGPIARCAPGARSPTEGAGPTEPPYCDVSSGGPARRG